MPQSHAHNIGSLLGHGKDLRAYGRYDLGAGDSQRINFWGSLADAITLNRVRLIWFGCVER